MSENAEQVPPARPVWRRAADTSRIADSDIAPVCSGVVVGVEQEYERLWELKRQMQRDAEAEKEGQKEAEEREAARHPSHHRQSSPDDEEDEDKAAERWRNDRYAVKLLRQDDSAWARGGADPGMLG